MMAKMNISVDTSQLRDLLRKVEIAIAGWEEDRAEAFIQHYEKLQQHGCEPVSVSFKNGRLDAAISDDFCRAFAEFGGVL